MAGATRKPSENRILHHPLTPDEICNFLFSWGDFITKYERLNSYHLEILWLQQFEIQNS